MENVEMPATKDVTVEIYGITEPLVLSPKLRVTDPNINRALTQQEKQVYDRFLAILGQYSGSTVRLQRQTWPYDLGRYTTRLYDRDGHDLSVYMVLEPEGFLWYSMSECPRHIPSWRDVHTMGHKDIEFSWNTKQYGIMTLTREYHGYGNGTYYQYDISTHRVRYVEDD